ncbi:NAD(P)/FAD-dependent oxidoreductase [Oryzibacter oryziterrae]|uniref:NAD(P)/FAD-dependent oxidoreductase n=1 Tax=Oryzibacter oryziterrae TaxID=2766474 RepID=UPI001F3FD7DB|nr:FAD-binding oxidoreductase [Oryzibacter oryziterrae]
MGPQVDPVPSDLDLPSRADVVIIGGGIIGTSAALFLAERGVDVVLVEKGHIAGEQSSRNWGWCRQARRESREFGLIRESLKLWKTMDERVGGDTGFKTTGIFFAARDESTVTSFRDWVRNAADAGIESEMIERTAIDRLFPGDRNPAPIGLYCASDGRAEPQKAAPAIAVGARKAGAKIFTDCAARGIETAGGRVVSVVTERGTIACTTAVVAGGAWTRRFLKDLDLTLPQLKVRSTVARTNPVEGGPECAIHDGVIGLRKRADGGYSVANGLANVAPITPDSFRFFFDFIGIFLPEWRHVSLRFGERFFAEVREWGTVPLDRPSPYEACRVLDPAPDVRVVDAALAEVKRRFPALADARFVQRWAGMIDVMPDLVPVISPVDSLAGLIVATGFSGHGFGIGPGAGHLVADLATGAKPITDPFHFRFSRYADGTCPKPELGL